MDLATNTGQLLAGAVFGFVVALLGGALDYRRLRSRDADRATGAPPLIMIAAGLLAFLGLVAFAVSLIVTGGIGPAVVMGIGVGIGFNCGFGVLFLLYMMTRRS